MKEFVLRKSEDGWLSKMKLIHSNGNIERSGGKIYIMSEEERERERESDEWLRKTIISILVVRI